MVKTVAETLERTSGMKSFHDMTPEPVEPQWPIVSDPAMQTRLGCELKTMFDSLTAGPLPDRLVQLADALDEAFRRGELFAPPSCGTPRSSGSMTGERRDA